MLYWKSLSTGEIYKTPANFAPTSGSWELTNKREYLEYIKKRGQ